MKERMYQELASLSVEQKANLDGLISAIQYGIEPGENASFNIPKNSIMSEDTFPQFVTWYMQDQIGSDFYPVFDLRPTNHVVLTVYNHTGQV